MTMCRADWAAHGRPPILGRPRRTVIVPWIRIHALSGVCSEHDVVVNGVRLWYRVAGAVAPGAPPVVFLHGGSGYSSYSFAEIEGPLLEKQLRMIYLDQRGSGRSERPWTRDYKMATLVEDLDALRRSLGVSQLAVITHSFGGMLALEYASAHPEHVSKLVLVDVIWRNGCRMRGSSSCQHIASDPSSPDR